MRYKDIYSQNLIRTMNRTFSNTIINNLDDVEQIPVEKFLPKMGWEVTYGDEFTIDYKFKTVTLHTVNKKTPANRKSPFCNERFSIAKLIANEVYRHINRLIEVDMQHPSEVQDFICTAFAKQLIAPRNLVNELAGRIITALEVDTTEFSTNDIYTIAYRVSNVLDVPTQLVSDQLDMTGFIGFLNDSVINDNIEELY